jgi:quinol-cytochrome oxidoreductase complex cytochrome b subunit
MAIDAQALNRAATLLGRLAALAAGALVVTGVPLILLYRPDGGTLWLRTLHSLSSTLFLGAAAGLLVVAVVAAVIRTRTWTGWPLALAAFAVAAAGSFTGNLVAWDQLGLWAVTVGGSYSGVIDPLSDEVRFIVVGDVELSQGTYLAWTVAHLVVVPVAAALVGWLVWRRYAAGAHETPQSGGDGAGGDGAGDDGAAVLAPEAEPGQSASP